MADRTFNFQLKTRSSTAMALPLSNLGDFSGIHFLIDDLKHYFAYSNNGSHLPSK